MIEGRDFAAVRIQGARQSQEDDFGFRSGGDSGGDDLLMVIADGMGGHAGGARASGLAIEAFLRAGGDTTGQIPRMLEAALGSANDAIAHGVEAEPRLEGMGCTAVGAVISGNRLWWVSVGDSPFWLIRNGDIERLNEDHSLAPVIEERVRRGELSPQMASAMPGRNTLRSALTGLRAPELVDLTEAPVALLPGDRLVLATDGLMSLTPDEILDIAGARDRDAAGLAAALMAGIEAKANPRQDNATALVVVMPEGSA